MENFDYDGQWWLPGAPNEIAAGKLVFSNNDGITLELNGSFRGLTEAFETNSQSQPIILGVSKQGKVVTLVDCESRGTHISMPGFVSEGFRCQYAFVGAHFYTADELAFHKVKMQTDYLPDWVGISGLTLHMTTREGSNTIDEIRVSYRHPEERIAETSRGKVAITFGGGYSGEMLTAISLRHETYLRVEVDQALPFGDLFIQTVAPLLNLIGLGTNRPNSLTRIDVYSANKKEQVSETETHEIPIQAFFSVRYFAPRKQGKLFSHDMLFTFDDIAANFSDILERWFSMTDALDSVYRLYFAVQQTPGMYLQQQFTNLVQAAESYHRRAISPPGPPSEEHLQMLQEILAAVPEQHKELVGKRLQHSHEPALADRLDELFEMTKEVIKPLIRRKKNFIFKVTATRNYQTHYDPVTTAGAVRDNVKLYYLTQVLHYMVKTLLLLQVGLTAEQCVELFRRNEQYNFAVREHPKM